MVGIQYTNINVFVLGIVFLAFGDDVFCNLV